MAVDATFEAIDDAMDSDSTSDDDNEYVDYYYFDSGSVALQATFTVAALALLN